MSSTDSALPVPIRTASPSKWWIYLALGIVFVLMGAFVFANLILASIVSAIFFGAALAVAGGFQIVHAFSERTWKGFFLSLLLGLLYLGTGVFTMLNPVAGSLALTLVIAAMLAASGVIRLVLAYRLRPESVWLLVLSGILAILLAVMIILGWPQSGLLVLGLFLGIDMVTFGVWWMMFAFAVRSGSNESGAGLQGT